METETDCNHGGAAVWCFKCGYLVKPPVVKRTPAVEVTSTKPKRTRRECAVCDKPFLAKRKDARF